MTLHRLTYLFSLCALLSACTDSRSHGGGDDDDDDDDDEAEPEIVCGWNAKPVDGDCECKGRYEWCDDSPDDCCAYFTNDFDIIIVSAKIDPYKTDDTRVPWDWNGNVPDWLLDSVDLLSLVYPEAQTWSEVLDMVDTYAPELVEGTVPPDAFVDFWLDDEYLGYSSTDNDTLEPVWNEYIAVTLHPQDTLYLDITDEDIAVHDWIETVPLTLDDAQHLAGGTLDLHRWGRLFKFTFAIEPH